MSNLAECTPITTIFVGIGLFELFQLRQDVHAVDAAVGPEIEQHELAAQVFQVDGPEVLSHSWPPSKPGATARWGKGCAIGSDGGG